MTHPPPFSLLPYEIISQICQHPNLDKDDLAALRLTCKSHGIHDAATASLGKRFEDITVLFSEHSFETLVNICKHPVFSRCVRGVKLSSIRCHDYERLDRVVQALQSEDALPVNSVDLQARIKHLHDLSDRIHSYASRARGEIKFAQSNKPLTLLTQAFQLLAQAGVRVVPGIAVTEDNILGCGKGLSAKNGLNCLWLDASSSTLKLLNKAVTRCKLPFAKLSIDIITSKHPYNSWTREKNIQSTTFDLFSHAEALDLGLFCSKGSRIDQDIAHFVQKDISNSTQIKALRVVALEWRLSVTTPEMLKLCTSIPLPSLESLSLVGVQITISELQAFFTKVQATLRNLSIVSCQLNTSSWIPAVVYIKDNLSSLNELHLARNEVDSEHFVFWPGNARETTKIDYEGRLLACLDLYGQNDIHSSLAQVLASYEKFVPLSSSASANEDEDW